MITDFEEQFYKLSYDDLMELLIGYELKRKKKLKRKFHCNWIRIGQHECQDLMLLNECSQKVVINRILKSIDKESK
jgi:hypothetical protein